ncbi:MAG TPA: beta-N-acetylhexosaminidase [Candidatus Acidoferrales bacterium]|nr:beta-N-acetylhexosaminidase [Candidatus Acidoferrales bacterium]
MMEFPSDLSAVGRHFLVGLQKSVSFTEHDERLLSALRPAGIILFRDNFKRGVPYAEWLAAYRELIDRARACIGREQILISIDHESGAVFRPPPPITNFGTAAKWASRGGEVGAAMAVELRSLGINLNYAPVVDIHTNPANPVIGSRAFGTDADLVIASARSFLKALEQGGVLGCPKHFPGHGDTSIDSHYDLPVVNRTLEELRRRELLPFAAMVQAGARIIMSAHILYPAIDPQFPATLSKFWLSDVLRGEMGFQGVITTDDIGMGAVSALFGKPGAAVNALQAGCDLLMMSAHWTETNRTVGLAQDLLEGLNSGALDAQTFAASETRIAELLAAAPTHKIDALPDNVLAVHETLRAHIAGT